VDSHQRRRALLMKERRWLAHFRPTPPALTGTDLVPGQAYFVLMDHHERCWLRVGGKCCCRPRTRFYVAEP
jgi:hypothetical protein